MMIWETGAGTFSNRSLGATGFLAIWQCTHSMGSERDTERVEVAAGIDRAVHPSGLFGRHVGERPRNRLGRIGGLPLAGQARGEAEPAKPALARVGVHQNIGGLDVLVDDGPLMQATNRGRKANG